MVSGIVILFVLINNCRTFKVFVTVYQNLKVCQIISEIKSSPDFVMQSEPKIGKKKFQIVTMYHNVSQSLINTNPIRAYYCSYLWRFFSFAFSNFKDGWLLHTRSVRHPEAARSKSFIDFKNSLKTPRSNVHKILY